MKLAAIENHGSREDGEAPFLMIALVADFIASMFGSKMLCLAGVLPISSNRRGATA
jgi:hypothetical protein